MSDDGSQSGGQHEQQMAQYGVQTYRYLRLSIVVVVASLFVSVLIEHGHASCWESSISDYYYTPVHSIFVGVLIAVGVSLIAIKGSTEIEDILLDVAGVLAHLVAFVPTSPPSSDRCASATLTISDTKAFIDNNVLAFVLGGVVAVVLALAIALLKRTGRPDASVVLGLVLAALLMGGGFVWYTAFRRSFLDHAHAGAAAAMFLLVFVVMVCNAIYARRAYRLLYALTAAGMVVSLVAVLVRKLVVPGWDQYILWLETLELAFFAVFWCIQTVEHWTGGVPTGAERAARTAKLHARQPASVT